MTKNQNLKSALAILKGTTVVAHDRRAADAIAVDYTVRQVRGRKIVRPSYGISNTMQSQLTKLADDVTFIGGMPNYIFEAK